MLHNDASPVRFHPSAEYRLLQQMTLVLSELTGEEWVPYFSSEKYPFDRVLSKELTSKERVRFIRDLFRSLGWQEGDEGQFKILGVKNPPTWQFQCCHIDRGMMAKLKEKHETALHQRQRDKLQAERQRSSWNRLYPGACHLVADEKRLLAPVSLEMYLKKEDYLKIKKHCLLYQCPEWESLAQGRLELTLKEVNETNLEVTIGNIAQQHERQASQQFLQEMQALEKRFIGHSRSQHHELWKLMVESRDTILKRIDQLEHTLIANTDARWQTLERKLEIHHQEWHGWTHAQARWQEQMLKYYEEQNKMFHTQSQEIHQVLLRMLSGEFTLIREDLEKVLTGRLKAEREATISALEKNLQKHHDEVDQSLQQGLADLKIEQAKLSKNQKHLEDFAINVQKQLGELSAFRATQAESEKRIETLLQSLSNPSDDKKELWEKTLPQAVKEALLPIQDLLLQQGEKSQFNQETILARCQTLLAESAQQKELLAAINVLAQSHQWVSHTGGSTPLLVSAVTEFPDYGAYFYQLLTHKAVTYYAVLASIASGEMGSMDAWDKAGQLADNAAFIADLFTIAIPGLHLAVLGGTYVASRCWEARQQNLCEKIMHFFSINEAEEVLGKAAYLLTQRYLPLIKPLTDAAIDRLIDGYLLPRWFDAMVQRYPEVESTSEAKVNWLLQALKMQRWKLTVYLETKPKRRDPWTAEGWLLRSGIEIPGNPAQYYILKNPYEGTLALRRKLPHLKYGFRYGVSEEIDARYEILGNKGQSAELPPALYWETHPLTSLNVLTRYRQSSEAKQDATRRDEEANTLLHRWVLHHIAQNKPLHKEKAVYQELSQWLKELEFDAHRAPNLANQWPIDIALYAWRSAANEEEKNDLFLHIVTPLLASLFVDNIQDLTDFTLSRNFNEQWSHVVFQAPYISPLFTALRRNDIYAVETLLNANINVNALDHENKHALHYLAEKNNRELFQTWEKGPQAAASRWGFTQHDNNGKTPIQLACEYQALDMLYCFGRLFDWKVEEGLPSTDEWGIKVCIMTALQTQKYEVLQALYQIIPGYFDQIESDNYKVQYSEITWSSVPVFKGTAKRHATHTVSSVVTLLDFLKATLAQCAARLAAKKHDKAQEAIIKNRYQTWARLSTETSLNDLLTQLHEALQEEPIATDHVLFEALWNPQREYIQAAKPLTDRLQALSQEMPTKTYQGMQFFGNKRQMSKSVQRDILQQALTELAQMGLRCNH